MTVTHFLSLEDFSPAQLNALIQRAIELKDRLRNGESHTPLKAKTLAMIFSQASTRTRVSFEVGMRQLGGGALNLSPKDLQLGRGEPIADTARVISRMADGLVIRNSDHAALETFAEYSLVPVINGLTDKEHPCQLLADILTIRELRGEIKGCQIAWVGDGNNVCHSWMQAARLFNFTLRIATPIGFEPAESYIKKNAQAVSLTNDPHKAAAAADVVVTDTWASMGKNGDKSRRLAAFKGFQVDESLMKRARKHAIFLHCLPAYRGNEVADSVLEGEQSAVFQAAENRLHAQKALLELLL